MVEEKLSKPEWVTMKQADLEKIVVELGKQGESPAKIGLILRDKHGVPKAKLVGKRISQILKDNKINFKSEKTHVEEKIKKLETHAAKNKYDHSAKKSLSKNLWRLNKLQKQ